MALSKFAELEVKIRVLYEGVNMMSDKTPWHYPLKWMLYTIPLAAIAGFAGSLVLLPRLLKRYNPLWVLLALFAAIFPAHKSTAGSAKGDFARKNEDIIINKISAKESASVSIKGLIPGMAVHFARCCHPLPGDRIVGIVTTGRGVTIHAIDCETLEQFADTPERWLDVSWGDRETLPETRVGRLNVVIMNEPGALGTISNIIAKSGSNITNLKITNRSTDFWDMLVDVNVTDTRHLNNVIAALRATPQVTSVDRNRGR